MRGIDRFVARKKIVERLRPKVLSRRLKHNAHVVPHGDRSGVVSNRFSPINGTSMPKTLAEPAIAAVREGKTVFVPAQWQATFFNWMENIQPWCISRQIWWGHQIPAWYGPKDDKTKVFVVDEADKECVAENEAVALDQAKLSYGPEVKVAVDINVAFDLKLTRAVEDKVQVVVASGATRMSSTPGSHPRCGRSRLWAGRMRRRN